MQGVFSHCPVVQAIGGGCACILCCMIFFFTIKALQEIFSQIFHFSPQRSNGPPLSWFRSHCTRRSNVGINQGFINVFFFLFLDERNNRVRVTNCQSPLSSTQLLDLRKSDSHGGPNFLFLELVTVKS